MAQSAAKTVDEYLDSLPGDRRDVMTAVRGLIRKNLPKGYEEGVASNMLSWHVPLDQYPDTYNGQPLGYIALAAQKNYYALYLLGPYGDPEQRKFLEDAFRKAGKKMDMGKSCLRFKSTDDLPLDALGKLIASMPPKKLIEMYERNRPKK